MQNKNILEAIQMISNAQKYYDLLEEFARSEYRKCLEKSLFSNIRWDYVEYEILTATTLKIHITDLDGNCGDDFFIVTIQDNKETVS